MGRLYNKKSLTKRRQLLRNNKTDAEKYLWYELRNSQILNKKFRRQNSIGNYILDFYCPELKLAIELDGEHHFEQVQKKYDEEREDYLASVGVQVIRFKNTDVLFDRDKVAKEIEIVVKTKNELNNDIRIKKI